MDQSTFVRTSLYKITGLTIPFSIFSVSARIYVPEETVRVQDTSCTSVVLSSNNFFYFSIISSCLKSPLTFFISSIISLTASCKSI